MALAPVPSATGATSDVARWPAPTFSATTIGPSMCAASKVTDGYTVADVGPRRLTDQPQREPCLTREAHLVRHHQQCAIQQRHEPDRDLRAIVGVHLSSSAAVITLCATWAMRRLPSIAALRISS